MASCNLYRHTSALNHSDRLTSTRDEDSVAPGLHVLLVALDRQGHSVLTGVKLAVDLGTGPRKHLTVRKNSNTSLALVHNELLD